MELANSKATTVHTNATPTPTPTTHPLLYHVPQTPNLLLHHHGHRAKLKQRSWLNHKSQFPKRPSKPTELPSATLSSTSSYLQGHRAQQSHVCQVQLLLWVAKTWCHIPGPVVRCCEQASGLVLWTSLRIGAYGSVWVWLGRVRLVFLTQWRCFWIVLGFLFCGYSVECEDSEGWVWLGHWVRVDSVWVRRLDEGLHWLVLGFLFCGYLVKFENSDGRFYMYNV